jgi:hypothetical protein
MSSKAKFLIPVAAAIAAITPLSKAVESKKDLNQNDIKNLLSEQIDKSITTNGERLATYRVGDELHGLILHKNAEGIMVAGHYSHSSHASHASHASHSSHFSSR